MTHEHDLTIPWTLHFDREGTEDVAVICDPHGEDLVKSRHFWLPEGDDPVPRTLAAMQLMVTAPKLLKTLLGVEPSLTRFEWGHRQDEIDSLLIQVRAAIAEATGTDASKRRNSIVIEVRGGVVQDVRNVPPGFRYEVRDYDDLEAAESDSARSGVETRPTNPDRIR
jgi:hypothetical protein